MPEASSECLSLYLDISCLDMLDMGFGLCIAYEAVHFLADPMHSSATSSSVSPDGFVPWTFTILSASCNHIATLHELGLHMEVISTKKPLLTSLSSKGSSTRLSLRTGELPCIHLHL